MIKLLREKLALDVYRARTERLKVLTGFLRHPVIGPRDVMGSYDEDLISVYNLAVISTLQHIRALIISDYS